MPHPYALGRYTAAALRARPRASSPLTGQLLLGEPVLLGEVQGDYVAITTPEDGQQSYVRRDQLQLTDQATFQEQIDRPSFALELYQPMLCGEFGMPVTCGARLPQFDGVLSRHLDGRFVYSGQVIQSDTTTPNAELLVRLARRWLHVPELRAGRTPTGVDPAALVRLLYRLIGIKLPASLPELIGQGETVDFVDQCQEGDVAFFDPVDGPAPATAGPCHLGIVLSDSRVLHVAGRVRVDGLDHCGIYNHERRQYTHRLRVVRRWLSPQNAPRVLLQRDRSRVTADARQMLIF